MIIELMIMLIVVGAGIIFVAWSNTRRRKQDVLDRREVEDSTGKLKKELERTANEIIGRMENHVTHLERILDESERNRMQLEGRVTELKKILKKAEGQSSEIRDLLARLEDTGAEVDTMQRKMEVLERRLNVVMTTPLPVQQPIQQPIQQPVTIPQMATPLVNPLMASPINMPMNAPQMNMPVNAPPIKPPQMNMPMNAPPVNAPPVKPPVTSAPTTQVTTAPPGPPMNPLGPITIPPPIVKSATNEDTADKDFDEILEESIAEPTKARESIVLSPENKQPAKVIEADPIKIEATRRRLHEASAEMAEHPPEEIPNVVENQAKDSKKKRSKARPKRDVRKAALEAIREAEKNSEQENKPAKEPKKVTPPEKPKQIDKKEQFPERRDLKLETTDSSIIREMLLSGMTIEEISRETGLGRVAIELIQEMTRRQLDRK